MTRNDTDNWTWKIEKELEEEPETTEDELKEEEVVEWLLEPEEWLGGALELRDMTGYQL